jgi:4-hydroxybenzoate polyprenyltransferase
MSVSAPAKVLSHAVNTHDAEFPLCVDLDGTLILTDLLLESLLLLIKNRPFCLLLIPYWLLQGRAVLKAEIALRVTLNPAALPYNDKLIRWLESERRLNRRLWLCTATNESLAERIAAHKKLFDGILASNRGLNLAGVNKAAQLVERFGDRSFDYCGNERRDIDIWKCARAAIVVNGSERFLREVAQHAPVIHAFSRRKNAFRSIGLAMRPHQWAKSLLVAVPLLAAHRANDADSAIVVLLAMVTFCLCSSSVYVLNDLLDLEADRGHPRKSKRPFAAGDLPLSIGFALIPVLLGLSLITALFLPNRFLPVLATYYCFTIAYSFGLKGIVIVDVLTLAGLYTLRIIAGAAAISISLSFWLLWFSMFLFLSLALVKRFSELNSLHRLSRSHAAGRDYAVDDLPVLQSLGIASGYLSVLVLALYINSPEIDALYSRPSIIWTLCILMLYWISRVWVIAQRGEMNDDPVVFALKDHASQAVGILATIAVVLAMR